MELIKTAPENRVYPLTASMQTGDGFSKSMFAVLRFLIYSRCSIQFHMPHATETATWLKLQDIAVVKAIQVISE